MYQNPYLPMPTAANAWAEGFTKGFIGIASPEPSENIMDIDIEAFNHGVLAGEEGASNGISLVNPCIATREEHGPVHGAELIISSAHIAHGIWEAGHLAKLAAGMAGIIFGLVELAISLPTYYTPPEKVLPEYVQPLVNELSLNGIDSMELFIGAGLDFNVEDCELCLTPLFKSLEQAREAAIAMNRHQWLVARWRTDMSNSFMMVDEGTLE